MRAFFFLAFCPAQPMRLSASLLQAVALLAGACPIAMHRIERRLPAPVSSPGLGLELDSRNQPRPSRTHQPLTDPSHSAGARTVVATWRGAACVAARARVAATHRCLPHQCCCARRRPSRRSPRADVVPVRVVAAQPHHVAGAAVAGVQHHVRALRSAAGGRRQREPVRHGPGLALCSCLLVW